MSSTGNSFDDKAAEPIGEMIRVRQDFPLAHAVVPMVMIWCRAAIESHI